MNTLVIVLIAAVCLFAGYTLYAAGWLISGELIQKPRHRQLLRKTDRTMFLQTAGLFCPSVSSIAGAGPVTGAIQAAAFGWLPVLLWVIIGGIFFGAVTDFGALYASVKNEGSLWDF